MRTATVRTEHAAPEIVAASVASDNSSDMETVVEDGAVVTTIERGTTGGLQSTVDDYLVNLDVATTVAEHARSTSERDASGTESSRENDDVTTDSKESGATDRQ